MSNMGLSGLFKDNSLDKVAEECLSVSTMLQKTTMTISEKSTTASSTSGAGVDPTGIENFKDSVSFWFDEPFLLFVRNNTTNVILFAGLILE